MNSNQHCEFKFKNFALKLKEKVLLAKYFFQVLLRGTNK